jgi:hypothetical protein
MPDNNADLALVEVESPRLADESAASCPVPLDDLLRYLADEVPGGEALTADALLFVRTAQVADTRYGLWRFNEPDSGDPAYATVSLLSISQCAVGYGDNYYGLTPEQYILGDYHLVF